MPASEPPTIPKAVSEERLRRAREWKKFRRDFLFSQSDLAVALKCSLRTVQCVEGRYSTPMLGLQRRFRELVREQKRMAA
jgi:hypothetical protein